MARFRVTDRVKFRTADGKRHHGRVTDQHGRTYRLVDHMGSRFGTDKRTPTKQVIAASLKKVVSGVFVLDTQLDSEWSSSSTRAGAGFWREVCSASRWDFATERVHSLEDLLFFLGRRPLPQRVLVFNGHGHHEDGFQLTNGETFGCQRSRDDQFCIGRCPESEKKCKHDPEKDSDCDSFRDLKLKKDNAGKVIIFSSCLMGRNADLCRNLKGILQAEAVIAYSEEILDNLCFFAEPQLVSLILDHGLAPAAAVAQIRENMRPWKGDVAKWKKDYPLVCY